MWQIIAEPGKEWIVTKQYWNDFECASAYCESLNLALPNTFFGLRRINDKYLPNTEKHETSRL
jgi:hypothetical protein